MTNKRILSGLQKWIVLLSFFGVLFNVRASYACVMMTDMDSKQNECCCGSVHRMQDGKVSNQEDSKSNGVNEDPDCGDTLRNCCKVEVSLDLDDGAGNEPIVSNSTIIKLQLSIVKIFDDPTLFWDLALSNDIVVRNKFYYIDIPSDPAVLVANSPLYLKTARFRI